MKAKPKINKMSQKIIQKNDKSPNRMEVYDRLKDGKSTVRFRLKSDHALIPT